MRLPVQTDEGRSPVGALVVEVGVQVSFAGLYTPPVTRLPASFLPPQTIMRLPVQTAPCWERAWGGLVLPKLLQVFVVGLYLIPVFIGWLLYPPHTSISVPVQTAL